MDKFTEELVMKVAVDQEMDPEIVAKVVGFQFKDMLRATADSCKIEMTWFGKFYVSRHKCQKRLFKLRDFEKAIEKRLNSGEIMSELRISSYTTKLRKIRAIIDYLRSKIDYEIRLKGLPGGGHEFDYCQGEGGNSREDEGGDMQGVSEELRPSEEIREL